MQSKHVKFSWKHLMLTIAGVFLLFSLVYFSSCKKTDFAQQEQLTVVHDGHFKEQFFKTTSTNPTVLKIVGLLKAQNEKTDFISSLPAKCGLPIWDKLILPMNNSSTANWGPEDSLENIIIPLTENNANLSSLLYAKETATGYDLNCYTVNDYLYNKCHGTNVDTVQATAALSRFFYMECRSFGTTQFKHIPANLFTYSPLDNDGLRSVTIGIDSTDPSIKACPIEYILCPVCGLITCPVTVRIYHCNDEWPIGNGGGGGGTPIPPGGGGTNVPPPSGPGQGGGGDGGGTGSPCVPDFGDNPWYGLMPLPPNNPCMPPPYQLSANDIRVINQLNDEDSEVDDEYTNNECKGTKRTGNINFSGTKEHWLIQLDYLSKNFDADREYAIPQSSGGNPNNKGYADLANLQTNEIFEIKPDNPAGIASGTAEVNNYVAKAILNCPTRVGSFPPVWHTGTNYNDVYLPSSDPTKCLKASKATSGVIVYDYISLTAPPYPIALPSSVLDKLKDLVRKLRDNANDLDKTIAEYFNRNPDLAVYIKGAAIGAAVAIVVGTILEDIATFGGGIWDDWVSFKLAYRIVRFAWAL